MKFKIKRAAILVIALMGLVTGCSDNKGNDLCPNGHLDPGEECDFGYNSNQSVCYDVNGYYSCLCSCSIVDCTWNYTGCTKCGDGFIDEGEECDNGGDQGGTYCDGCYGCKEVSNTCGDGFVCGDEECDDGNTQDEDGCSSQCMQEIIWR